jgi:hypothetical protein
MATATNVLDRPAMAAAPAAPGQQEVAPWILALAKLLDNAITIPGTNRKIGLDPLIGLIPVIGDLLPALMAVAFYQEGKRLGVTRWTQWRMLANTVLDVLVGLTPIIGDILDAFFKSNAKNVKLLLREVERLRKQDQARS